MKNGYYPDIALQYGKIVYLMWSFSVADLSQSEVLYSGQTDFANISHDHPTFSEGMEPKALPDFPMIQKAAELADQLQRKVESNGGLKKMVGGYLENKISNAFGFKVAPTVSAFYKKEVASRAKTLVKATTVA